MRYNTREEWLHAAIAQIKPLFKAAGADLPKVQVSVGWPYKKTTKTIGQCWSTKTSEGEVNHLYISPVLGDPVRVLDVLIHELVHAVDNVENGHGPAFRRLALRVGLAGPMKATHAGEELKAQLEAISRSLGDYPHHAVTVEQVAAQKKGSRLIKVECELDGYVARTTRKWLDELGTPICPACNQSMVEEEK